MCSYHTIEFNANACFASRYSYATVPNSASSQKSLDLLDVTELNRNCKISKPVSQFDSSEPMSHKD